MVRWSQHRVRKREDLTTANPIALWKTVDGLFVNRYGPNGEQWNATELAYFCGYVGQEKLDAEGKPIPCTTKDEAIGTDCAPLNAKGLELLKSALSKGPIILTDSCKVWGRGRNEKGMKTIARRFPRLITGAACLLAACGSGDPLAGTSYSDGQGGASGGISGGSSSTTASGGAGGYFSILCTSPTGLYCPTGGTVPVGCTTGYFPNCSTGGSASLGGSSASSGSAGTSGTLVNCGANGLVDTQTDSNNCGACGVECSAASPSTAECVQGRCLVTLATGQFFTRGIAVDATSVYWTSWISSSNPPVGSVMKVSRRGGPPTILAEGQDEPDGLVVDATSVYWVNHHNSLGAVMKAPLAGGNSTVFAPAGFPQCITIDATSLYWTEGGPVGSVMKMALAGGAPITLVSGQVNPYAIRVDASSVYWSTGDGAVRKVPLDGGEAITLVSGRVDPAFLALDSANLYWSDLQGLMKIPLQGGSPVTLDSTGFPNGVAVDGSNVYFGAGLPPSGWGVMKVPVNGGATLAVVVPGTPWEIAVDGNSVFWTESGNPTTGGSVMMATPK